MKKGIFVGFVMFGAAVGWVWSLGGPAAARLVMVGLCAIAGAAVGGALANLGARSRYRRRSGSQSLDDWSQEQRRNDDHAPTSNAAPMEPGPHMFDPDRFQ